MIDKELLAILACPESHQTLAQLSDESVAALNECIGKGCVTNVGGTAIEEELAGGLVREDKTIVYPIRDEIPVLLVDEGLVVGDLGLTL